MLWQVFELAIVAECELVPWQGFELAFVARCELLPWQVFELAFVAQCELLPWQGFGIAFVAQCDAQQPVVAVYFARREAWLRAVRPSLPSRFANESKATNRAPRFERAKRVYFAVIWRPIPWLRALAPVRE